MKYCSTCGIEFSDSAYRCPSCGAEPANAAQTEAAQTEYVYAEAVHAERVSPNGGAGASASGDVSRKVENHLVKSVIATVCCCVPFGIVAIVFAAQVGPHLRVNNIDAALEASKKADLWGNLAIGVGVLLNVLLTILYGVFFVKAFRENGLY